MKNQFEHHIKNSLESFEADYNPADWADMQSRLRNAKIGKSSGMVKGLLIAASVLTASGIIYYYYFSTADKLNNVSADISVSKIENVVRNDIARDQLQPMDITKERQTQKGEAGKNDHSVKENIPVITKAIEENPVLPENKAVVDKTENKPDVKAEAPLPVSSTPVLSAAFHTDLSKICEGAQVKFLADASDAALNYKWTFGDGESSSEQNPKHAFAEAGAYLVKLRVTSRDKKQVEQKNTIIVIAAPSVQLDYSPSDDNGLLVNFEADGDKVVDWKWDFGDKKTASSQNPSHTYARKGIYKASVTAKNSAGCSAMVVRDVNLKNEIDLLAPNAFSPDGNGVNDTWMPVALLNGDYVFTLTISNKAGSVVFRTSDKNNPWDGQNAKPGDTFRWIAVVKDKNGEDTNYQGLITISE